MLIHIYNQQKALLFSKSALRKAALSVISYLKLSGEELSIYVVGEKKMAEIHGKFFNDPTPTDCMTFPIDASYLGDLFICPQVAIDYAKDKELDPHREMLLYAVHGILHLAGYDDLNPKDKKAMRKKEKSCMEHLDELGISINPAPASVHTR